MIYSTMVGVGYMHFCQQERAQNSANFDIKYLFSTKSRVMHLCLSTLEMLLNERQYQRTIPVVYKYSRNLKTTKRLDLISLNLYSAIMNALVLLVLCALINQIKFKGQKIQKNIIALQDKSTKI